MAEAASPTAAASAVNCATNEEVFEAKVVAMFPPRPDAIMTILHSEDYLPGVQTLLYSLKKKLADVSQNYAPEIVVCVTPDVKNITQIQSLLVPALCTRLLPIENWETPEVSTSIDSKLSKTKPLTRTLDNHAPGWTKLHIFGLQQYDTILYIDSDCLVLRDISNLLDLNKVYTESEALIAAAPDLLPPNHFNSGVMVIRPSTKTLAEMKQHATLLTTYDRSDTGFLNAYFPNWFTDMHPSSRLSVGYNAQQAMFDWTTEDGGDEGHGHIGNGDTTNITMKKKKNSNFWDVQISGDLSIVHYSNQIKPWQEKDQKEGSSEQDSSSSSLVSLWKDWHRKSKTFLARYHKEAKAKKEQELKQRYEQENRKRAAAAAVAPPPPSSAVGAGQKVDIHKAIRKRYKQLRREGQSSKDAMDQARVELLPESQLREHNPSEQVATMFGMM